MHRSLFLLLAACSATAPAPGETCAEGLAVEECAPSFTLPDGQDAPWTLADHRGDVVVIEISGFW